MLAPCSFCHLQEIVHTRPPLVRSSHPPHHQTPTCYASHSGFEFLEHSKHAPSSGPLQLLLSLPGIILPFTSSRSSVNFSVGLSLASAPDIPNPIHTSYPLSLFAHFSFSLALIIDIPSISPIYLIYHLYPPLERKLLVGRDFCLPFLLLLFSQCQEQCLVQRRLLLDEGINSSRHQMSNNYLQKKALLLKKNIKNLQMGKAFHYCQRAVTLQPSSRSSSDPEEGSLEPWV